MFGLSWTQILLIVVIGVFLLGPERIPVAVQWLTSSLRKVRTMAQGAQDQLNSEFGGEIAEMRRQIQELQSLKELQELKELRDLHPKNLLGKGLLGDGVGTGGGVAGFLGLDKDLLNPPVPGEKPAEKPQSAHGPAEAVVAHQQAARSVDMVKPAGAPPAPPAPAAPATGADPLPVPDPLPAVVPAEVAPPPEITPAPAVEPLPAVDAAPAAAEPVPVVVEPAPETSAPSMPEPADAAPQNGAAHHHDAESVLQVVPFDPDGT